MMPPLPTMLTARNRHHASTRARAVAWFVQCSGVALLWLGLMMPAVAAQVRASVSPQRIAFGDTATLTLSTDQLGASADLAPLRADFEVLDSSDATQVGFGSNGIERQRSLRLLLRPRRAGTLMIPPIRIGSAGSAALPLQVDVADTANNRRAGSGPVWLETSVSDPHPYVQQSVGVTLRLYSAIPLMDGEMELAAPAGASLQRVGDQDIQSSVQRDGRRVLMVERHYLLVPAHAGDLDLPPAQLQGRSVGGASDVFGGLDSDIVRASGNAVRLQVRAVPAAAPAPWLPLRDLQLRWEGTPAHAYAGEPVSLSMIAEADGATASQLPALELPPIAGVQVFADPASHDDLWRDGRPRTVLRRSFVLLPTQPGPLTVPAQRVAWWDVVQGVAREALLPSITLQVAPAAAVASSSAGDATSGAAPAAPARAPADDTSTTAWPGTRVWIVLAALFALLWLATLMWALHQRERAAHGTRAAARIAAAATAPHAASTRTPRTLTELRRALDTGGLDDVAVMLCGLARPPVADLDALLEALADPAQQTAVRALQQAQWASGDAVAARAAVRSAFTAGASWRLPALPPSNEHDDLPPLYPR